MTSVGTDKQSNKTSGLMARLNNRINYDTHHVYTALTDILKIKKK
jgi:hypothetical protein